MRNKKSFIFVMTLIVLLIGITAASAADTNNNTVSSDVVSDNTISTQASDVTSIASDTSNAKAIKSEAKTTSKTSSKKVSTDTTKTSKSETKSVKKTDGEISANDDNVDTYSTNNGVTKDVQTTSKINTQSDITSNNQINTNSEKTATKSLKTISEPRIELSGNTVTTVGDENGLTITAKLVDSDGNAINDVVLNSYLDDDHLDEQTSKDEGTVNFKIPQSKISTAKEYTFKVVSAATDDYSSATNSTILTVNHVETSLTINDVLENIDVNSPKTINGTLTYGDNKPIAGATINLNITNVGSVSNITDSDGKYSYTWTPSQSGTVEVNASYDGDDTYGADTANTYFDVDPLSSNLTVNVDESSDLYVNHPLVINGTLLDNNNKAIASAPISITIADKDENVKNETTVYTNENGTYTWTTTTPTTSGLYDLTVKYNGDEVYSGDESKVTLDINKIATDITVNDNLAVVNITKDYIINGTLTDVDGNPISDADITIAITGMENQTVTTNSTGGYNYTYKTSKEGTYNVTVLYKGDDTYSLAYANTSFDVEKLNAVISVDNLANVNPYAMINVTGKLIDQYTKAGLGSKRIIITITNTTLGYDQEYSATTADDGNYKIQISAPGNSGLYNVTVKMDDSDVYDCEDVATTGLFVKTTTDMIVDEGPIEVFVDDEVTINGTLTDKDSNPISDATISVEVGEISTTVTTNSTGGYNYTYKANALGADIPIKFTYDGSDIYVGITAGTTLNVIKLNTTLTLNGTTKYTYGKDAVFTVKVVDVKGNPVSSAEISGTVDGINKLYSVTTGEDGTATFTIPASDIPTVGNYTLTATYAGTEAKYNGNETAIKFEIEPLSSVITVNVKDKDELYVDNPLIINGTLKDSDGNLIKDAEVSITITDKAGVVKNETTVYTNENGTYTWTTVTPNTDDLYDLTVKYAGTTTCYPTNKTVELDVEKMDTSITTNPDEDVVVVTKEYVINGTLVDDKKNPISDATIIIAIEGETNQTVTTDKDGKYTYTYTPKDLSKLGPHTVDVVYKGSNKYYETSGQFTFEVEQLGAVISIDDIANADPNTSINVTGKLVEQFTSKPISGATVNITVNGDTYQAITDENGIYKATITTPSVSGEYTVNATYADDSIVYDCDDPATTNLVVKTESAINVDAPIIATINNKVNITGTLVDVNGKGIADATVVITIDGATYTTTTDKDGKYVYEYTATKVGEDIPVKVAFNGNDNYTAIDTETTMDVEKISSTLTIDTISPVDINDTVVITGKLTEEYGGKAIAGASVVVNVNGDDKEAITDANGVFKVEFTAPSKVDTYTVTAKYAESDIYYESSDETTLDVEKINSVITVDEITNVVPNSNINITGKLVTDKNTPIANTNVTVTFNGETHNVTTDANGNYKVEVTTPSKSDNYTVDVSYGGSDVYVESYNTTNIYVGKLNTTTTVDAVKGDIHQNVTLVAHVVDQYNKTVTSGEVIFTINGVNVTDAKGNVIYAEVKDGIATITTQAINAWAKNDSQIIATYLGNEMYNSSQSTSAPVEIALKTPTIRVLTDKSVIKVGDLVNFIAQVTDNGQLVKQGKVVFKLNGKTLKNEKGEILFVNVVNGIAQLPYSLDTSFSAKVYNLTAVYAGRDYNRMEATVNLTVVKTNTHVEADIVNVTGTNTAKLKVSILDENNELVGRWTKVTIKVNGKTVYNETNVTAGMQYFDINLPAKDIFNITIIAGENSVYKSSRTTISYDRTLLRTAANATKVAVKTYDNNNNIVTKDTNVSLKVDGITVAKQVPTTNGILNSNITIPTSKETNNITANTNSTVITTVKA